MPNCITNNIRYKGIKTKKIESNFKGGQIVTDAGVLLLRQAEEKLQLINKISKVIKDNRNKSYTKHNTKTMLQQRVFGIACGYEDGNDHTKLRKDPIFKIATNKLIEKNNNLASPSTLCRFENKMDRKTLVEMSKIMLDNFINNYQGIPSELILDFDATDDKIHGNQENKFYHGYYDSYCFLPLYVFCGEDLLVSYLRGSKIDGAKHTQAILKLLVEKLRNKWPNVEIIFRGDSGFCRHKMFNWCEKHNVKYITGIAKNTKITEKAMFLISDVRSEFSQTQEKVKKYTEIKYAAKTWSKERRVIVKAEYLVKGENTRYIVTNIEGKTPENLYKQYTQRGDMENRIKEQQLYLFADRTSCKYFISNQFRVFLSAIAYIYLSYIRKTGLKGTKLAKAQCSTIRLKLLKIGALIVSNTKKIIIQMSENFIYQDIFRLVVHRLC